MTNTVTDPSLPQTSLPLGLVGFFGWGNFGDELFLHAWKRGLAPLPSNVVHDRLDSPYFSRPLKDIVREHRAFVIGGGDLIIPWSVSGLYWRPEYLEKPVHIVGVGVPTWKKSEPAVLERYRSFLSHPNVRCITLRDRESADWIAEHIQPRVAPTVCADLVFSLDLPHVTRPAGAPILGITVRHRRNREDDLSEVKSLAIKGLALGYRIRLIVLGTGDVGKSDLQTAISLGIPGAEYAIENCHLELAKRIGECSVFATMKFHGTVVGLMYQVPTLSMVVTDKTRNLLRSIDRLDGVAFFNKPGLADRLNSLPRPLDNGTLESIRADAKRTIASLRDSMTDKG